MATRPPPIATPRTKEEYRKAVLEQRRWFMIRLWIAGAGFLLGVAFGGVALGIANDAQNNANDAASQARETAANVAQQAADFRTLNVANDLRACVRANQARDGVRINSMALADLIDAVIPGLPDPPASTFISARRRLAVNLERNAEVDCPSVVDGIELLPAEQIQSIVSTRGRKPVNP